MNYRNGEVTGKLPVQEVVASHFAGEGGVAGVFEGGDGGGIPGGLECPAVSDGHQAVVIGQVQELLHDKIIPILLQHPLVRRELPLVVTAVEEFRRFHKQFSGQHAKWITEKTY